MKPTSLKFTLSLFTLLVLLFSFSTHLHSQVSKEREKEIKKYWKRELKHVKSIDHEKVAASYPEIGWLSGLWKRVSENEEYQSFEILGKWKVRKTTMGYTASAFKDVFIPKSFLYSEAEFLGKPVVVENEDYYDIWYFVKGTGGSRLRWFFVNRIKRISKDRFQWVYYKSYTIKKPSVDFVEFYKNQSPKIAFTMHWKSEIFFEKVK